MELGHVSRSNIGGEMPERPEKRNKRKKDNQKSKRKLSWHERNTEEEECLARKVERDALASERFRSVGKDDT
jgi:hypothetical protein